MAAANDLLADIYHYEQITDRIGCSGQPRAEQFERIRDAGYKTVINLALPSSDNAIAEEGSIVAGLDMRYFHIPVQFDAPTVDDLRTFFGVMRACVADPVWVHCAVNARVSAFLYHYLRYEEGRSEAAARTRLLDRWQPQMDETWRRFLTISKAEALQPPRRDARQRQPPEP